jgi:hypothetical protein
MTIRYDMLPEHMQEGTRAYVERGVWPGDFLRAVLSDSLTEAYARADYVNTNRMQTWAMWLYNQCPRPAWGSLAAVEMWIERGGLQGNEIKPPSDAEENGTPPNAAERKTERRMP